MQRKILALCAATMFLSCAPDPRSEGASTEFALSAEKQPTRLLWKHLREQRSLPICLALIGYSQAEFSAQEQKVRSHIEFGVNGWFALLRGNPDWGSRPLRVTVTAQNKRCAGSGNNLTVAAVPELRINWYKTEAAFQADACRSWNAKQGPCRSHASSHSLTMNTYIDPAKWPESTHRTNIAHEFGHMLGMGDTYKIEGYQEPLDQPPSMMRGGVNSFTDDDRLAVAAALQVGLGKPRSCGPGASEGAARVNSPKNLFCLAGAKAVTTHVGSLDAAR